MSNLLDSASYWNSKGIILDRMGKHKDALECFEKARAIDPQDVDVITNIGISFDKLGKPEEALKFYEVALQKNEDTKTIYNKGISLSKMGRYSEAVNCFKKVLNEEKNNKNAIINLAIALQKMDRLEEAISILKEWGEFDYIYTRAHLMLENGKKQIEDSINLLQMCLNENSESIPSLENIAYALKMIGMNGDSIRYSENVRHLYSERRKVEEKIKTLKELLVNCISNYEKIGETLVTKKDLGKNYNFYKDIFEGLYRDIILIDEDYSSFLENYGKRSISSSNVYIQELLLRTNNLNQSLNALKIKIEEGIGRPSLRYIFYILDSFERKKESEIQVYLINNGDMDAFDISVLIEKNKDLNIPKIEDKIDSLKSMEYRSYTIHLKPKHEGVFEINTFCNYRGNEIYETEMIYPLEIPYLSDEDSLNLISYLKVLRLDMDTTAEEIRRRWKELSKHYHPDTTQDEKEKIIKESILKEINEAYEGLKNYY
ncbi:MAG: tetratricopeptide repeat protein [Candidatus Methanofastidiosum sp.]|nr:tetratricopeptide repeat protein [Methanofastidiosum sp.]